MRRSRLVFAAAAATSLVAALAGFRTAPAAEPVAYPEGYRGWTHVKSMVIEEGHALYDAFGGIHHVYANEPALAALRSGGTFPKGAVLVFDLLEAVEQEGAIVEGRRKVLGVMEKDPDRFAATGGWGFEGFGEGRARAVTDAASQCFACHESQRDRDYVFSRYRE